MAVLVPALNPDEKLVWLVQGLKEEGFARIVVVDDGSDMACGGIFGKIQEMGCLLAHHESNLGKGTAIKTALRTLTAECGHLKGYITADADGQHLPEDIRKIAGAMEEHPDSLILGVRDFGKAQVPLKSMLGNRITSVFFRLTSGITCPDTQTGLRGIPGNLLELALAEEGTRYDYEMNFLMDAVRMAPVEYVPIATVYEEGNRKSHFRPMADSCLIYSRFLRFAAASLSGAAVDYLLFYGLTLLLALPQAQMIFMATGLARIGSGIVNYLMNRYWSFHSRMPVGEEVIRYFVLFFGQMIASAGLVSLIALASVPALAAKIVVDTALFFVSFRIQKNWVFRQEVRADAR